MGAYSDWLAKQPKEVQNDILRNDAEAFRNGTKKVDKFEGAKPLTLAQFADKSKLINQKG